MVTISMCFRPSQSLFCCDISVISVLRLVGLNDRFPDFPGNKSQCSTIQNPVAEKTISASESKWVHHVHAWYIQSSCLYPTITKLEEGFGQINSWNTIPCYHRRRTAAVWVCIPWMAYIGCIQRFYHHYCRHHCHHYQCTCRDCQRFPGVGGGWFG